MDSDLTFITNEKNKILKKRIIELINNSKELKFLVGFFYFSGIRELYKSIKNNPEIKIKVLVGLDVDKMISGLVEYGNKKQGLSNEQIFNNFLQSLSKSINSNEYDTENFYEQANYFIELIKKDHLIIRKTLNPNHAKLYIFKIKDDRKSIKESFFITGSSNLTSAGLLNQHEFNVEISDYGTKEAEEYFDELWDDSIIITENNEFKKRLIKVIENKTLIVKPFEAFALVLKTYLDTQKHIKLRESFSDILLSAGYKPYKYQLDAISQGLTVVENYGGVILADVVGMGKSIIASGIAYNLNKRGIVIAPPSLIGDDNAQFGWKKYLEDFNLYDWKVRSCGLENLRKTLELVKQNNEYEVIIIDEVHRFRNQDTESYEILSNICRDKIVILLSATPFNNSPKDILSLLKLIPGKSQITLDENLESKFRAYNWTFKKLSNIEKNKNSSNERKKKQAKSDYKSLFKSSEIKLAKVKKKAKQLSNDIKRIIEPVLIRRNRIDLREDPEYSKEVYELSNLANPKEIFYDLSKEQLKFYDDIVKVYFCPDDGIRKFKGAIYQPFVYEQGIKNEEKISGVKENFEFLSQRNLYDFMRRLLVKRFESSFGAFEKSIRSFYRVYDKIQEFIKNSGGKFIMDRKLMESIYDKNIDEISEELKEFEQKIGEGNYPKSYKIYHLNKFKKKEEFLRDIDSDKKLFREILDKLEKLNLSQNDPKFKKTVEEIRKQLSLKRSVNEPPRKILIFTEYTDTAKYLEDKLEAEFPDRVISTANGINVSKMNDIFKNFDASVKKSKQENQYDILLTTDKLSEGVNLNRAGTVINYDIPWNPTRVIQRVGRVNRIGTKVFDKIFIYNCFPTEKGANYVKSREIAEEKMFLIHNALGEDSKIFSPDEEPEPSKLYSKIMENPEKLEDESWQTKIRKLYWEIKQKHPEIIERISKLPPMVKSAKGFNQNNLLVFIKKNLSFFVRGIVDNQGEIKDFSFNEVLNLIKCSEKEKSFSLSDSFWENYSKIKNYQEKSKITPSEMSLERKAYNNLRRLINNENSVLNEYKYFIGELLEDIVDYKTLSEYTLRRLSNIKTSNTNDLQEAITILEKIRDDIGENYLEKEKKRRSNVEKEVIIAIENIKK